MKLYEKSDSEMETRDHFKNGASPKSLMSRRNITQRTFLFFAALCISIASTFAQDVITLKNGEDIHALVQEIGEVDVKYKKFDNPNGPNYTLKKSEIFMIRYQNGTRDVFQLENIVKENTKSEVSVTSTIISGKETFASEKPLDYDGLFRSFYLDGKKLSKKEIENLFQGTNSWALYEKGKRYNGWGVANGVIGAIIIFSNVYFISTEGFNTNNTYGLIAGGGLYAMGWVLIVSGNKYKRQATELYNNSYRKKNELSLNVGITQSGGIGLTLNF